MKEFFGQYLGILLALVGLAIALTVVVFRKRLFERGSQGRSCESSQGQTTEPA